MLKDHIPSRETMVSCIVLLLVIVYSCNCAKPKVTTSLGELVGHQKLSFHGRTFSAFEGIPYAKPPVGNRRFEEAEPFGPWIGVWNATFPVECIQTAFIIQVFNREEDCLFINVYTPRENPSPEDKLDVLIHIHGGGFMFDSGHSYPHPDFWMDRDIVYVTFNYRLGIFGFLSTQDDVVPGNNGLKDQVLALKWINKHISSFGGNPDSITIFGMSAGAMSVHLHYLSPMSKGLFHRGFSQSGVGISHESLQGDPLGKAKALANSLGCPEEPSKILVDCLKQRHHREIWSKIWLFYGYQGIAPYIPMGPCIEKGSHPFLGEDGFSLLKRGEVLDVPWFLSIVAHEGMFFADYTTDEELEDINKNWVEYAPYLLEFNFTIDRTLWNSTAQKLRQFYLGDKKINRENGAAYAKMLGDRVFMNDFDVAAKMQAKHTKSPVYFLNIDYTGEHKKTISHAEDGQFYFYKMYPMEPTPNEIRMKDILIDMVVAYAKTGKPHLPGIKWEPTKYDELIYVNISGLTSDGIKLQRTKKSLTSRYFWESLGLVSSEN